MADRLEFQEQAKNILKAELKRRGISYRDLADRLMERGVSESERNIANKISRGSFTAAFFLECLDAAGVKNLTLAE
jgi:transcriptional regulator with XRE-family HTH domain